MENPDEFDRRIADLELRLIKLEQIIGIDSPSSMVDLQALLDKRIDEKEIDLKVTPVGQLDYSLMVKSTGGTWGTSTNVDLDEVLEVSATSLAESVSGLGHPVKIEIYKTLLTGPKETTELLNLAEVNTTGQLYHHLQAMVDVGLVERRSRNLWAAQNHAAFVLIVTAARTLSTWRGES